MKDLTLITCSYNTPDVTITMLRSFVSIHEPVHRLILIDNSTNNETAALLSRDGIPFVRNSGGTHGHGINMALSLCQTKYALLVDTDVVFLKDHSDIFETFKTMGLALMGKIEGDRGGKHIHKRVNPWHCLIDVEQIKNNNITYFNETKMKDSFSTSCLYDIGSTFFEDVKTLKLKIGDVDLHGKYFFHLEGMSWYKNKFNSSKEDTGIDFGGTHNNIGFVEAYEQKYSYFNVIKTQFDQIDLKDNFIG